MGVYLGALIVGVPCLIFIIYCYTPKGKEWRRFNGLLYQLLKHTEGQSPCVNKYNLLGIRFTLRRPDLKYSRGALCLFM